MGTGGPVRGPCREGMHGPACQLLLCACFACTDVVCLPLLSTSQLAAACLKDQPFSDPYKYGSKAVAAAPVTTDEESESGSGTASAAGSSSGPLPDSSVVAAPSATGSASGSAAALKFRSTRGVTGATGTAQSGSQTTTIMDHSEATVKLAHAVRQVAQVLTAMSHGVTGGAN